MTLPATIPLVFGLTGGQLQGLLVTIVVLALIALVGRIVLKIAWKLLLVAGLVVAALYVVSLLAG